MFWSRSSKVRREQKRDAAKRNAVIQDDAKRAANAKEAKDREEQHLAEYCA